MVCVFFVIVVTRASPLQYDFFSMTETERQRERGKNPDRRLRESGKDTIILQFPPVLWRLGLNLGHSLDIFLFHGKKCQKLVKLIILRNGAVFFTFTNFKILILKYDLFMFCFLQKSFNSQDLEKVREINGAKNEE